MTFINLSSPGATEVSLNDTEDDRPGTFFSTITFGRTINPGERIKLSFEIASLRGNGFTFTLASPVAVVEGANGWYPQVLGSTQQLDAEVEQPDGTTTFFIPHDCYSVSNGILLRAKRAGRSRSETWGVESGTPRSFAVGPFKISQYRVGAVTVGMFLLSGTYARSGLHDLVAALTVLQSEYGPFPYRRYDVAEVANDEVNWAGLAARELTVEQSFVFKKRDAILFFAHEAAHAWWGNLVGKTGPGIFMVNEAMAQYSAFTVLQTVRGQKAYEEALNEAASAYFNRDFVRSGDKALSALNGSSQSDYDLSLTKGTWVYHMLRLRVGDTRYFETFRNLVKSYAGKEMTLADIRAAFLSGSQERDSLRRFFAEWLDRPGAPVLTWQQDRPHHLLLEQWQPGAAYHVSVPLVISCNRATSTRVVAMESKKVDVRIEMNCLPINVTIDPGHTLLMWRPQYSPSPGL
jgi:hypothetical protein